MNGEKSVTAVVVAVVTLAVKVSSLALQLVVVVVVVVGKLVVVTVVVRPAAVVSVVVVRSGRAAAIRPGYPYPLAQTKFELSCMLSGKRPQVSVLKKCNQTQRNPLWIK